jgi:hypothetical protein
MNVTALPTDLLRNILFVSVETGSGKVELTVKTSGGGGEGTAWLCGIRDTSSSSTGPILTGCVPVTSGETQIDFTPTGPVHDNAYVVVLGMDKNSDGQLSADEVVTNDAPKSRRFYIKAVTLADYDASLNYLDFLDNAIFFEVASDFLSYFDGDSTTIDGAAAMPAIIVPITETGNPTHIAGSIYTQTNGETTIPKFKLPEGSTASNEIEKTLDRDDGVGLRSVVKNVWEANKSSLAAPFIVNSSFIKRGSKVQRIADQK